jgi:hypothetical protein
MDNLNNIMAHSYIPNYIGKDTEGQEISKLLIPG